MPWMESVSLSILIPYGPVLDPPELEGLSSLVCEMSLRGCGKMDSRQFLESLENLGCETSEAVSQLHTGYGSSLLADNLLPSLDILADLVRRPQFPEDQLEAARQVLRQNILALEDEPARRMMRELQRNFWPDPWSRSSLGTLESIERLNINLVRQQHSRYFQPDGSILSIAGKFDWPAVLAKIETLFADWQRQDFEITEDKQLGSKVVHISNDSNQTHIGVAIPSTPLRSPDYMAAWSSVGILSGGMSSRLFDEIREKRGLCYSVYASYSTLKDRAGVFCYCGTGGERAQQSLDVLIAELERLRLGIEEDELRRLKRRAKSSLVMQQESTAARSGAMTRDWYHLGRVRSLSEIESGVHSLSKKQIDEYLATRFLCPSSGSLHIATLGPEPLSCDLYLGS